MSSVNKVIIVGRLGNDPEYKQFSNGGAVTKISVATSEKWRDNQGQLQEKTEWHRVSLFNRGSYKLADIANNYLRKGSQVYIEGKLETNKWQDQNGQDRYTTEIRADQMQMLSGGMGSGVDNGQQPKNQWNPDASNNTTGATVGYGAPNQGNQQGYGNQDGYPQGGNNFGNQAPSNNQNTFAPQAPSAPAPQPQQTPAFNNQTTTPAGGMTDTPKDDDIPF